MMIEEKIDRRLDLRGKVCPYPTFETAMALRDMAAGEVLEVITDYYPAKQTIPDLANSQGCGYELVGADEVVFRIIVRKS